MKGGKFIGLLENICVRPKKRVGWGSRRLRNLMMLCKQVWRMMHNPDSLCHKVFKARFFPDCSILEAKESTIGSYAWKSILSAKDVIKKGMVWRVGNGQSVCIREDKWLQDKICRTVITPLPFLPPDAKVNALIDAKSIT